MSRVDVGSGPRKAAGKEILALAAELSGATGVPRGQVVKVLEALGVSKAFEAASSGPVRGVELGRVRDAVRSAMEHVVM